MRKLIAATTLTVALTVATSVAASPVLRPSDSEPRMREITPIERVIKAVKKVFGVRTTSLPSQPIP